MAGPATVSELAVPFAMTLSAIGQVELAPEPLTRAEQWFTSHRARWERRLSRLADVLAEDDDVETRKAKR